MKSTTDRVSAASPAPAGNQTGHITTVFVVEELAAIRDLLVRFINGVGGFRVIGGSGDRGEAERECARLKPELAVIDWLLRSDTSGVNLAEAIRQCSAETKILVFSAAAEAHFVSDAIAAGVAGFVVKSATLDTLVKALRNVAEGKQFFCPEMAGVLRELLQRSSQGSARSTLLTQREREVLREIAKGHFSKEIAATFDLSVFTIENIRRRIMRKTGFKSVAELTLHALRLGLIESPVNGSAEMTATEFGKSRSGHRNPRLSA
jgi:DNA-binding NarL/FixJ family response regulator